MDEDAVADYADAARSTIEAAPQMDEANTKAAILQDFLTLLDWEIPENTQLEYSVRAFGRTYKVDYALVLEGTPVAFLEAKGVDTPLNDDHEEQLSSYMSNENVNYGILTNAEEYRFFQRRVAGSAVSVRRVGTADLETLRDHSTLLEAYTKADIESGEGQEKLERINDLREAQDELTTRKDDLATELTDVLTEAVSGSITSLAESQSKELIDRLIADIESEIDSDSGHVGGSSDDETPPIEPQETAVAGRTERADITGDDDARVAVFPTRESGLSFLKENNAWGYVRVGSEFDYVAMYVTGEVGAVKYVAKVRDVVSVADADLTRTAESYVDRDQIDDDKRVVRFEPGSLHELADPIPFETKYPQSLRYTTLGALRAAETTDDML